MMSPRRFTLSEACWSGDVLRALNWKALPPIPWENPTGAAVQRYATALLVHPLVLSVLLLLAAFAIVASSLLKREAGEEGWLDGLFGHDEPGTPVAACHALLSDQRLLGVALGIAAAIYVVLYTSFFTHIPGVLSGSFGAIGYWLAQHDVQRAEQPWFYYLLLLPQYDPLAAIAGGAGVALTGWRLLAARLGRGGEGPQPFARGFIAYWAVASVAIYSWAGEKMPWMDIHLVLPLTLLAAALLGAALDGLMTSDELRVTNEDGDSIAHSSLVTRHSSLKRDLVAGGLILAAALAWFLGAARLSADGVAAPSWRVLYVPALAIVAVVAVYTALGGWWRAGRVAALALGAALLLFHVHAGWALAYQHGDVPQDMIVYVQTSPDVTRVMREIDLFSAELTGGKDLTIMYDDNTSWPFQWYLRDYPNKQYFSQTLGEPPAEDVAIVLVGNENLALHPELANALTNFTPQAYSMRWHFPEDETYRPFAIAPELSDARNAWSRERPPYTLVKVARSVLSSLRATARPDNQARLFRLLAYRELGAPLGSYDFTIYVRTDLLPQYNAIRYR